MWTTHRLHMDVLYEITDTRGVKRVMLWNTYEGTNLSARITQQSNAILAQQYCEYISGYPCWIEYTEIPLPE